MLPPSPMLFYYLHFIVTVATTLYWSMIEAGPALIAACLPVLRAPLSKLPFDKMMASARGVFSLHSQLSSRLGKETEKSLPLTDTTRPSTSAQSGSSRAMIVPRQDLEDPYKTPDLEMAALNEHQLPRER